MSDESLILLTVEAGVATIRLNRPKVNAINTALLHELLAAAQEVTARTDVRAVVVYGGERAFAAGADILEMKDMTEADMSKHVVFMQSVFDAVAAVPKPVVAAVTGYALGGGCELALACDIRVAGDSAQLGQPEIQLGIIPGIGGTQRLARLVGPSRAKDIVFTGRFVKADEAHAIGLVDKVVPADEVYTVALAWAQQFAQGPAVALRAAKEAIDRGLDTDLASGLVIEGELFASLFSTEDRTIGMASFAEHGPGKAEFRGR